MKKEQTNEKVLFCHMLNMFCSELEQEDFEVVGCDGDCKNCEEMQEV